jgi:hypothetical protein
VLLSGADPEAAKKAADYAETIHHSQVLASAAVQAAIRAGCDADLNGELRVKALKAMERLLGDGTPPATRFNAAKFILERGDASRRDGDKPLGEMTEAELTAVIDGAKKKLEAGLVNVTPDNGAHR